MSPLSMRFSLSGRWVYRSLNNSPRRVGDNPAKALAMILSEGDMELEERSNKAVSGVIDMGADRQLEVHGRIAGSRKGLNCEIFLNGIGLPGTSTDGWRSAFRAYPAPRWPFGRDMRPTLVGSVLQTVPHVGAGVCASATFVMISKDRDDADGTEEGAQQPACPEPLDSATYAGAPSFATHIRPKFRQGDIGFMARLGFRMADVGWMTDPAGDETYPDHAHARRLFDAIKNGVMPPDEQWPEGWVDLYARWIHSGCLR